MNKDVSMQIRMTKKMYEAVVRFAKQNRRAASEMVRLIIEDHVPGVRQETTKLGSL